MSNLAPAPRQGKSPRGKSPIQARTQGEPPPPTTAKVPFRHWFPVSFDLMGRWESRDRDGNVTEARPPQFEILAIVILGILVNKSKVHKGRVICTLTNHQLAAVIGRGESEVKRHLATLEEAEMIRRVYGPSKRIRIGIEVTLPLDVLPIAPDPHEEVADTPATQAEGVAYDSATSAQQVAYESATGSRDTGHPVADGSATNKTSSEREEKNLSSPVPPLRVGTSSGCKNAVVVDDASASAQGRVVVAPAGGEGEEPPDVGSPIESRTGIRFPARPVRAADMEDDLDEEEQEHQEQAEDDAGIGLPPSWNLHLEGKDAADVIRSQAAQSVKAARKAAEVRRESHKPTVEEQMNGRRWVVEFDDREKAGTLADMQDWPYPHWMPEGKTGERIATLTAIKAASPF